VDRATQHVQKSIKMGSETMSKKTVCIVIALAALGCSSESTNENNGNGGTGGSIATGGAGGADASIPTPIHNLSETAHATDYDFTITGVAEANVGDAGVCPIADYFAPAAGKIKLGTEVKITNTSDKQVPVNPFYAKLTDSGGYSYTSTFGGCNPELVSVKLDPGQTANGWITFEIPQTSVGLIFTYNPFIVSTDPNEVKFDLGR
jgi:hypothetical protein